MRCLYHRPWPAALLYLALTLGQTAVRANHDELVFFEPVTTPSGRPLPAHALQHMARPVRLVAKLLERAQFNLNHFPGNKFVAQRDRFVDYVNGDVVWIGHVLDEPLSRVTFASRGGVISGVVDRALDNGNELYELMPSPDGD